MIANIIVAMMLVVFLNFRKPIIAGAYLLVEVSAFVLVLALIGIVVTMPLVLVEFYLYRRKKGVLFQWTAAPARPRRNTGTRHRSRPYPRTTDVGLVDQDRVQTRLFESGSATEPVSRAALLLTVGDKLAAAGKKEAAKRCYRQIVERFADAPQAREASRHLSDPARP